MDIEFDLTASSAQAQECGFTLWIPAESAEITARRHHVELIEPMMTDLPVFDHMEGVVPEADTFLGQWL
jgi:hypothetical protein